MKYQHYETPMYSNEERAIAKSVGGTENIRQFLRDCRDRADAAGSFDFATLDIAEDHTETMWVAEILDSNGNPVSHKGYPISAADESMFKAIQKLDELLAERENG